MTELSIFHIYYIIYILENAIFGSKINCILERMKQLTLLEKSYNLHKEVIL